MYSADIREELSSRIQQGTPPDTFQANAGHDLKQRIGAYSDGSADVLWPLEDLAPLPEWFDEDAFPPEVLDAVSEQDELYAVPLNIHRINVLYYNVAVFRDHDVAVPEHFPDSDSQVALDALEQACLDLSDTSVTPIVLGASGDRGPLASLVFENLLIAEAGAEYYEAFFTGWGSPDDQQITDVLERAVSLFSYLNDDAMNTTWEDAATRLYLGQAAMMISGDWTRGSLDILNSEDDPPKLEYGEVATPGTTDAFVFTSDSFPVARGSLHPGETLDLLATFASVEGQRVFNRLKGSIPARDDVGYEGFDDLRSQTITDFLRHTRVLALSGLAPREFLDPVEEALVDFFNTRDPTMLRNRLRNYYDLLQR
jgi:glucose/mannose transport system substrate-binding protein